MDDEDGDGIWTSNDRSFDIYMEQAFQNQMMGLMQLAGLMMGAAAMDPFANDNETNMYGSIAFKQNAPSSFKMMSEFNGQGGNPAFDADNSANVNNVKQIGEYLNSSTIYE